MNSDETRDMKKTPKCWCGKKAYKKYEGRSLCFTHWRDERSWETHP